MISRPKGSIMVCIMLFMLLLSVLILSIMTMMLCYYKSIENTLVYEKCFFLAQGGREEALAFLSERWEDTNSSWYSVRGGEYHFEISHMGLDEKKIISRGRINGIERKIETLVSRADNNMNLKTLCNYSIYCDGPFILDDTKNIVSCIGDPLLAITGDLTVKNISGGRVKVAACHGINAENSVKDEFFAHLTVTDTHVPEYNVNDMSPYKNWLMKKFILEIWEPGGSGSLIIDDTTGNQDKDILYIHDVKDLYIKGICFNGIIILDNIENVYIDNRTQINGVLIAAGGDTSQFIVYGQINGSMLLFNMERTNVEFNGNLNHDNDAIEELMNYFPNDLTMNNCTKNLVNVIKWNEIG